MSILTTSQHLVLPVLTAGTAGLVLGGGAWYAREVQAIAPDTTLEAATESGAYADAYRVILPILQSSLSTTETASLLAATKTISPQESLARQHVSTLQLAQALFTCPAFQLERWILTLAGMGPPPPKNFVTDLLKQQQQKEKQQVQHGIEEEEEEEKLKIGCQIGPWTVVDLLEPSLTPSLSATPPQGQIQNNYQEESPSAILLKFPGGHSYIKATTKMAPSIYSQQQPQHSTPSTDKTIQVEFILGSNLDAAASGTWACQALLPFHQWYSRVLCQNAARHLQWILIMAAKAKRV